MNNITVADLTLNDLEPYINGKKFTGEVEVARGDEAILKKFLNLLEEDDIAKEFFNTYDVAQNFYTTMPDFKQIIPKELQVECFYAAKNGVMYKEIPAFCVFLLKKAIAECDGIPNLIPKVIPSNVLNEWCKKGYFGGGLSLKDVICNICTPNYKPLCNTYLKNVVGDFTEIYVTSTDMVAAIPNKIAECLDDESIRNIVLTSNGLSTNDVILRTMCNYVGAINSYYDLRKLI